MHTSGTSQDNGVNASGRIGASPAPLARGLLGAYFDSLDHGLMLIDRDNRVALCTAEARYLLGISPERPVIGRPAGHVLRRTYYGSKDRAAFLSGLRGPLRDRRPVALDVMVDDAAVSVDLRPLPGAGWALAIADRSEVGDQTPKPDGWHDALTGLSNRSMFGLRLQDALGRLQRSREGFAVLAIDLDRFKSVNDTLGHPIGDELLREVARRLEANLRATDTVARLGGDEFAVLQSGVAAPSDSEALAHRIVGLVGRAYEIEGHHITIGTSVGIALAPQHGADANALLNHADLALYGAKRGGRDMFRFFDPELSEPIEARRRLGCDLRDAVVRHEFELLYQPRRDLEADRLIGCEARLRWRHPTRGLLPSDAFIPLAEEIGLIRPIEDWAIGRACEEAAGWSCDIAISVGLSLAQFTSDTLIDTVRSALAISGLAPHRLELQIADGLLRDRDRDLSVLHALRVLGLRLSLIDLGTGSSSLGVLRCFAFDEIKIGRSLVSDDAGAEVSIPTIRAIARLGETFGIATVVEGVETRSEIRRIRRESSTEVQGCSIGRAVSAPDIEQMLQGRSGGI